ncbi:MAG: TonB-dependent receptor plug domain-containing protein [Deltaproteobacteria bacterium]|nr:TonB-dependent receptor plug domain-containing protein [Deltaproteobacteria bacterium]
MDDAGIPEASVFLTLLDSAAPESDTVTNVDADANGHFRFDGLLPGRYQMEVVAADYSSFAVLETLEPGELLEVVYRLERATRDLEVVVRTRRPMREVARHSLSAEEIQKIPGTRGDALRSVQNMPGMAQHAHIGGGKTSFGSELIIRGSSHGESAFSFNDINVPMLYHFQGMTSIINSDLIDKIDYYPGNFSVRYGRATGGVVNHIH